MENLKELKEKLDNLKEQVENIPEPDGKLLIIAEEMKRKAKINYN